jgi:hypothetical protein
MLAMYVPLVFMDAWTKHASYNPPVHKLGMPVGVPVALHLSRHLKRRSVHASFLALGTANFFVFAAHEPLLTIVRKLIYRAWAPDTDAEILMFHPIAPATVISLSLLAYVALRHFSPRVLELLSEGRIHALEGSLAVGGAGHGRTSG